MLLTQVARVEEGAQVKRGDISANAKAAVILSVHAQPEGPAAGASGLELKYRESRGSSPRPSNDDPRRTIEGGAPNYEPCTILRT